MFSRESRENIERPGFPGKGAVYVIIGPMSSVRVYPVRVVKAPLIREYSGEVSVPRAEVAAIRASRPGRSLCKSPLKPKEE